MSDEPNNNKNCEKQLELFKEKLSDFSELPPDHELMRWIDATGVIFLDFLEENFEIHLYF